MVITNIYEAAKQYSFKKHMFVLQKSLSVIATTDTKEVVNLIKNEGYSIQARYLNGIEYCDYTINDPEIAKIISGFILREYGQNIKFSEYQIDFEIGEKEAQASICSSEDARFVQTIIDRKGVVRLHDFILMLGIKQDNERILELSSLM